MSTFFCRLSGERVDSQAWDLQNALQSTTAVSGKQWWKIINCPEISSLFWRTLTFHWKARHISLTEMKTNACWEWTSWCFPNTFLCWTFQYFKSINVLFFISLMLTQLIVLLRDCRYLHKEFQKLNGDSAVFGNKDRTAVPGYHMLQNRDKRAFCFCFNNSLNTRHSGSYICIISQQPRGCFQFKKYMCFVFRAEQGELSNSGPAKGKGLTLLPGGGWGGYKTACVCSLLLQIFP